MTKFTNTTKGNRLSRTNPDWLGGQMDARQPGAGNTAIDERGGVTTYTHDSQHRVPGIKYPDQSTESFTRNAFDPVLIHTLCNDTTETNSYDLRGLLAGHTDAAGGITSYTYDASDRVTAITDPAAHATQYAYNERGQVTQVTNADGTTKVDTYDSFGNRLTATDELGHVWTNTYDEFNRLVSTTDPRVARPAMTMLRAVSAAAPVQSTHPASITRPSRKVTTLTYDTVWQKTSETVGAGSGDAATTPSAYDTAGNITSSTDPCGQIWSYTYNAAQWIGCGQRVPVHRKRVAASVNLYDYRNRVYSSEVGRFMQTDPVREEINDVNFYRYVVNDPTKYIDSAGLDLYLPGPDDVELLAALAIQEAEAAGDYAAANYARGLPAQGAKGAAE